MRTHQLLTVSAMLLATICIAGIANAVPQLVVDAPSTSIVGQQVQVTVTANENQIDEATVFFSLSGSQFQRRTDINGTATFTPTITGNLSVIAVKQGYAQSEGVTVIVIIDEAQPTTMVTPTSAPLLPSPSQLRVTVTPTSTMPISSGQTPTFAPLPTPTIPPVVTTPTPSPKQTSGFEALFAIAGLLAVTYLVLRRKE